MPSIKTLYMFIFLGTFVYFLLYSVLMRKLLVVQISFREIPNAQQTVEAERNDANANVEHSLQDTEHEDNYFEHRANSADVKGIQNVLNSITKLINEEENTQQSDTPAKNEAAADLLVSFLREFGSSPREDENAAAEAMTANQVPTHGPDGLSLPGLIRKLDSFLRERELSEDEPCPIFPTVSEIIAQKESVTLEELESELNFVQKGGQWKPSQCEAKQRVAIMIPFRNRQEHLNIFLRHMHAFLKLQLLDYRIFVVEQAGEEKFNRGTLANIGFTEALKVFNFNCVIFHDVDLLPLDTRNDYSCPSSPRHMSPAVDTNEYKLQYKTSFGGVQGFWKEHFIQANGFPNRYWGWGGEDDDLYQRIIERNLHLTRPAQMIGRYTMLPHGNEHLDANPNRLDELKNALSHIDTDGVNSVSYDMLFNEERPLYTLITVQPLKS